MMRPENWMIHLYCKSNTNFITQKCSKQLLMYAFSSSKQDVLGMVSYAIYSSKSFVWCPLYKLKAKYFPSDC